MLEFIS